MGALEILFLLLLLIIIIIYLEDVPLMEFMCPALTRMPGESYRRRLDGSLLLGVHVTSLES